MLEWFENLSGNIIAIVFFVLSGLFGIIKWYFSYKKKEEHQSNEMLSTGGNNSGVTQSTITGDGNTVTQNITGVPYQQHKQDLEKVAQSGLQNLKLGYINDESVFALRRFDGVRHIKVVRTVTSNGVSYTAGHFALDSVGARLIASDTDWANRVTLTYG